jgi:hypothetical protein
VGTLSHARIALPEASGGGLSRTIEALALVLLALPLGRLMEREMRRPVKPTGTTLTGWAKQATERPTGCMMVTQCSSIVGGSVGPQRQLAWPLSVVQRQSLTALGVPTACFTTPNSGEGVLMAAARLSRLQKRILWWLAVDHQRTRGLISSSHQELVRTLQSDKTISATASGRWRCGACSSLAVRLVGKRNP